MIGYWAFMGAIKTRQLFPNSAGVRIVLVHREGSTHHWHILLPLVLPLPLGTAISVTTTAAISKAIHTAATIAVNRVPGDVMGLGT